jgi:hypothetical protein
VKQLRSFLGLTNYWRRFICSYSAISAHLRELLLKDVPFKWTDSQEQAFNELKDRLCSSPVLGFPDMNAPFIVTTDASKTALGYILSQLDKDGNPRVICYAGRSLKRYERNWTTTELEMAAVIQAITTWHPYLANQEFIIETDHISLQYLKNLKLGNSRLIRWALLLSMYKFNIRHVPGKRLPHVDALSRRKYEEETDETPLLGVNPDTYLLAVTTNSKRSRPKSLKTKSVPRQVNKSTDKTVQWADPVAAEGSTSSPDDLADDILIDPPADAALSAPPPITLDNQRQDHFFAEIIDYLQDDILPSDKQRAKRILIQAENYTIENDLLVHLRFNRHKRLKEVEPVVQQVCVPQDMREALVDSYHAQLLHTGIDKTYMSVCRTYYWPKMYSQI